MSTIRNGLAFLKRQSHNYRILLTRSAFSTLFMNLTNQYSSIYANLLGADYVALGTMRSLGSIVGMIIALPAGWISDRYNLKKVYIIGLFVQLLWIFMYAFAQDWIWILVASLISPFTMALMFRSQTIMISKGLRNEDRAQGFAFRSVLSQLLGLLAPVPAAFLVTYFGGSDDITIEGVRPLYYIRLIGMSLIAVYAWWRLQDVPPVNKSKKSSFFNDFKEVFKGGKGLYLWIAQSALSAFIMGLYMTFTYVYAKDVKFADPLTLGLMTTASTLASIIFSIPMSKLTDTRGRRFTALLTRPARYIWLLMFVWAPEPYWLIVAYFFRGISMSGNAFQTWSLELVSPEMRGRWLGITNMINAIIRIPAPIIGGMLFENINPDLVFLIPVALGLFLRTPILAKIPETLNREQSIGA